MIQQVCIELISQSPRSLQLTVCTLQRIEIIFGLLLNHISVLQPNSRLFPLQPKQAVYCLSHPLEVHMKYLIVIAASLACAAALRVSN